MKTIVISAVNLNVGGTLTILRDCLSYLSTGIEEGNYRVVALVHKQELVDFPNIEYIVVKWPKRLWISRLWYEYVSMKKISKQIGPVYLWFSLHDTTPNVVAERRAVYCHNPFPFYKWKWWELIVAPKIVMFALFSKFIYRKNIHKNHYVIVQQQWLKDAFKHLFNLSKNKVVVALPDMVKSVEHSSGDIQSRRKEYRFIYPASVNSHKNFECLCRAASILEKEGFTNFRVYLTSNGKENRYAAWLGESWGRSVQSLQLIGFQDKETLFALYAQSDCLVFPSKVETWGLPISEFAAWKKPMLLADLPYAHETAAGSSQVSFFGPDSPEMLAEQMKRLIQGDVSFLKLAPDVALEAPVTRSWKELFDILLQTKG